MDRAELTAEIVRQLLDYDPATGIFRWRYREGGYPQWNARFAGKIAGSITKLTWTDCQYVTIRLLGKPYMAHCLAWLHVTGEWCDRDIDHKDGDGTRNAWSNLRPATKAQNLQNRGKNKNNTSGYKGVWYSKSKRRWCAEITADGLRKRLGWFATPEAAAGAYARAAEQLHGDFARVA